MPSGDTVKASRGCTLICEEQQGTLYISNLLHNGKDISVSINDNKIKLAFEKGMYAEMTKEITTNKQGVKRL